MPDAETDCSSLNKKRGGSIRKLLFHDGHGKGSQGEFDFLLDSLRQALQPVGALEELLVEKIAAEYWKLQFATQHETGAIREGSTFILPGSSVNLDPTKQVFRENITSKKLFATRAQLITTFFKPSISWSVCSA